MASIASSTIPSASSTISPAAAAQGPFATLEGDAEDLGATAVGRDKASSLRLACGDHDADERPDLGPVLLYEERQFRGRGEAFEGDDPQLADNPIGDDTVSSLRVAAGCEAILYRDADYVGASTIVRVNRADLNGTRVGDDAASSVRVRCREVE